MKKELKLPKPVETYIRAINAGDTDAFPASLPMPSSKTWGGNFAASLRSKNGPIRRSSRLMSRWTLGSSRA